MIADVHLQDLDERCCRGLCERGELHCTDIGPDFVRVRWCCHETQREDDGANDGATRSEVTANRPAHDTSPTAISVTDHHLRPPPRPADISVLIVVSPSLPWRKEGHGVAAISDIDIVGRIRWDGASKAILESHVVPVIALIIRDLEVRLARRPQVFRMESARNGGGTGVVQPHHLRTQAESITQGARTRHLRHGASGWHPTYSCDKCCARRISAQLEIIECRAQFD